MNGAFCIWSSESMNDQDCIIFLQKNLPKLQYRWEGFRKIRKQVCKRIHRRYTDLGLSDIFAYQRYLNIHTEELTVLDSLCYATISRFYRDRGVFGIIEKEILPELVKNVIKNNEKEIRCWSVGCCSGEEPYTVQIIWQLAVLPKIKTNCVFKIIATDRELEVLDRAKRGIFSAGSLKELPEEMLEHAFFRKDPRYIFDESTSGNMRNSLDFILFNQLQNHFGVYFGRFHQFFSEVCSECFDMLCCF